MQSYTESDYDAFIEYLQNPPVVHPLLAHNSTLDQRVVESTKIDFSAFDALLEFLIKSPVVPLKMIEDVITGVVIIKAILIDPPHKLFKDGYLQVARSVVRNVGSFFYSFDLNKMNEYMALQLSSQLCNFFLQLKDTPTFRCFQWFRVKRPIIVYPKTSAFVFIDHLLENLEELLEDTTSATIPFNYFILKVQSELRFWYSDLIEISSNPPLFLKETIETITKLAYDVEYALDCFLVGDLPYWRCICWLNDIFLDFLKIEQERRTKEDMEEDLKGKKTMIEDMLLGGDEQLNVISIVGPRGIGKRALAEELYKSPSVISHFESRAYISSQWFSSHDDIKKALLSLLGDLVDLSDQIHSKNNEELTKLLFECLEGKRFLVMISSLSFLHMWVITQRWFPDSHNGSRIILITEEVKFAFPAKCKSIGEPQSPQIWESFFQIVSCPDEMLEVGMKIAKRCKPESKTFVVHLLLRTFRKTVNQWEEVAQTLGSRVFGYRDSQVIRILDLTCMYLPDHLRSCFFYMGVFSYGNVLVSKLIRLWIAEGFVKRTASQSLEKTGKDYLADLISRNLLEPVKDIWRGKAARVYNPVVSNFLESKVMEDNFLQIERDSSSSSSSSPTIYHLRRLKVYSKWDRFAMSTGPFLQSLFFTPIHEDVMRDHSCDISFIYNKFKFLRILNIEDLTIGDSFIEVGVLVLLRYLAVKSSVKFIPPSISNIWNLETFHFEQSNANIWDLETFYFRQSNDRIVKVADCIWDMIKLRHIHIGIFSSFDLEPHRLENSSSILDNLQTLSEPVLAYGDNMEKMLRRLSGILKLKCRFLDSWDNDTKCNWFPMLGFLNKLISLKVVSQCWGPVKYPCKFNFPSNLKKLTLREFRMPWNAMLQLSMLKNLKALKLKYNAFEGERWDMENDVVFPKIKYLKLNHMEDLEYWIATRNNFPSLENLVVYDCRKLVEIPQDFAYITSIRMIQVEFCTLSAENSVRLIQDQHVKCWGHHQLNISFKDNFHISGI